MEPDATDGRRFVKSREQSLEPCHVAGLGIVLPAVDVSDDKRLLRLADQGERVLELSRVLIRTLLAKFDERDFVTVLRDDRILRIRRGVRPRRREGGAAEERCGHGAKCN